MQKIESPSVERAGSTVSGILLVAGTSIGAGMLALPMVTGSSGFFPAMAVNSLCWLFMMATGLLFLEATLWMEDGANILSMTRRFLGPVGKWIGGASFIFLYYCLLIAYVSGGAPLLVEGFHYYFHIEIAGFPGYLLFALLFGCLIFFGHRVVDRVNWLLMISLILSYLLLIIVGSTEINSSLLFDSKWGLSLVAAPVLFSAYGYHNIIPSMSTYLKRNVSKLRWAILLGTALPFVVYSLWQWMILGTLSQEEIAWAAAQGIPITHSLQEATGSAIISGLGGYFGFFALVTSFLGVSLSMVDFFADGLNVSREGGNRAALCALVFLPPALFAALNPGVFIEALGIAGGFGEAILNGLIPILMVWVGRYRLGLGNARQVPGGKTMLVFLLIITLVIMGLEVQHLIAGS